MKALWAILFILFGLSCKSSSGPELDRQYTLGMPAKQKVSILYSANHVAVDVVYADSAATVILKMLPCDSCARVETLKIIELR